MNPKTKKSSSDTNVPVKKFIPYINFRDGNRSIVLVSEREYKINPAM